MRTRKQQEVLAAGDILISQQRRNGWQERGLAHMSFSRSVCEREGGGGGVEGTDGQNEEGTEGTGDGKG